MFLFIAKQNPAIICLAESGLTQHQASEKVEMVSASGKGRSGGKCVEGDTVPWTPGPLQAQASSLGVQESWCEVGPSG